MSADMYIQHLANNTMELSSNFMYIISEDGRIEDVYADHLPAALAQTFEFKGKYASEVLPEPLYEQLSKAMEAARASGGKSTVEYPAQNKERWYRGSMVCVTTQGNTPFFILSVTDITTEKESLEALNFHAAFDNLLVHATSSLIQSSEANFDAALEQVLEQIGSFAGVDRAYFFRFSNEGAFTMSNTHEWCSAGVTAEKENLQDIPCSVFPEWMARLHAGTEVYIPNVSALPHSWQGEREILEPQGIQSLLALPVKAEGNLYGFIGFDAVHSRVVWDDSKRRLLQILADNLGSVIMRNEQHQLLRTATEQANKLAQEAMLANQHKSYFLANMSHEIRTPLNGILGFTELLWESALSDLHRQYLGNVRTSARSLLELINRILDFSKIEAGKMELDIDRSDLFEIVEKTCALVKHAVHKSQVNFTLDIPVDMPRYFLVDAVKLQQVIVNLLGNAFKFTEKGSITLKVIYEPVGASMDEARLSFIISDTGIGIATENHKRIFLAFTQADISTTRKYGGTGLGLAICNSLLQMMNSTLHLESAADKGSTFSFTLQLPCFPEPAFLKAGYPQIRHALVVDGNPARRGVLHHWLAYKNIKVLEAGTATDALALMTSNPQIDLLVVEEKLPAIKGLQLIQIMRSDLKRGPESLQCILLEDNKEAAADVSYPGMARAFAQPVTPSGLFAALDALTFTDPGSQPSSLQAAQPVPELQNTKKVLIAEDNTTNMLYTRYLVEQLVPGADIVEAQNGEEALKAYVKAQPHIILMDLQMPVMSGDTATREIRKMEAANGNSRIPIIAFTANAIKGVRDQCIADGFDDYITKPVIKEELARLLNIFLG